MNKTVSTRNVFETFHYINPLRSLGHNILNMFGPRKVTSQCDPRCVWDLTCNNGLLFKYKTGWSIGFLLSEKLITTDLAGLKVTSH